MECLVECSVHWLRSQSIHRVIEHLAKNKGRHMRHLGSKCKPKWHSFIPIFKNQNMSSMLPIQ